MNMDSSAETTSSPEAMSAPIAEMVEDLAESRSTTESPRPESRTGTDRSVSEPIDVVSPSHKATDDMGEVEGGANASTPNRHGTGCDLEPGTAEHDKLDDDDRQAPVGHDEYEPSMGFDYSNVRVRTLHL
jgi:hypothetical protein